MNLEKNKYEILKQLDRKPWRKQSQMSSNVKLILSNKYETESYGLKLTKDQSAFFIFKALKFYAHNRTRRDAGEQWLEVRIIWGEFNNGVSLTVSRKFGTPSRPVWNSRWHFPLCTHIGGDDLFIKLPWEVPIITTNTNIKVISRM